MYSYPVNYSAFRNEELCYLAARMSSMMPDNQMALVAEMRQRGLEVPEVEDTREFNNTSPIVNRVEVLKF